MTVDEQIENLKKKLAELIEEKEFLNKDHRLAEPIEDRIEIRKEKDALEKKIKAIKRKIKNE